jgi:hypothetical protein
MSYKLTITPEDWQTIRFVGYRYAWSDALIGNLKMTSAECIAHSVDDCDEGTHIYTLTEPLAWDIQSAFEADTEGGHSMFPMLAPDSDLYAKLQAFVNSIV